MRGERLGVSAPELFILAENSLEKIMSHLKKLSPKVLVVDSIQTVYTSALESAPGTVSQVRESAGKLMMLAKSTGIPVFLVGHVTKDGSIAGPRVLEHMVDTVLYFEGDTGHPYRILRAIKNRYGSTNEIGVFEMGEEGLREVSNPSELFLSERPLGVSGSVVAAAIEGSRPLLVELQALVTSSTAQTVQKVDRVLSFTRLFDLVITADDTTKHKPGPEPYLLALERTRSGNDTTIIIEDSINGIIAGKAAGKMVIIASSESASEELPINFPVRSVRCVAEI